VPLNLQRLSHNFKSVRVSCYRTVCNERKDVRKQGLGQGIGTRKRMIEYRSDCAFVLNVYLSRPGPCQGLYPLRILTKPLRRLFRYPWSCATGCLNSLLERRKCLETPTIYNTRTLRVPSLSPDILWLVIRYHTSMYHLTLTYKTPTKFDVFDCYDRARIFISGKNRQASQMVTTHVIEYR
jgi:hypothetical protein